MRAPLLMTAGLALCLLACNDDAATQGPPSPDATTDARAPDAMAADLGVDAGGLDAAPPDAEPPDAGLPPCDPTPPPALLRRPGAQDDDHPWLTHGGRGITPAGPNTVLPGFPVAVRLHPQHAVAYVASASSDDRRLLVVDRATGEVRQDVDRGEAFHGLALSPDGQRLYASSGLAGTVDVFDVQPDGTVAQAAAYPVGGHTSDVVVSPDGAHLWVGRLDRGRLTHVDAATGEVLATVDTDQIMAWQLAWVPGTDTVWATDLEGETVAVVDPAEGVLVRAIALPTSPAGMAVAPDGGTVWAAVSGSDLVVALDPATGEVTDTTHVAEGDLVDPTGAPLPNSNVNALAFDAATGRLYASRGADNAVTVLTTGPLAVQGALPTAWYPTALALDTDGLVVVEGKGGGVGPNDGRGAKQRFKGSLTRVDLAAVDLEAATQAVSANFQRTRAAWGDPCPEQFFPVPTRPGQRSPIEHVVLIVKENKTFDCVFGDLGDPRADVDPDLVRWGEVITPNQHALARAFAIGDNFYADTPNSDSGHSMLTSVHLTEFAERMWIEDVRSGDFSDFPVSAATVPDVGNLFTQVVDNGLSLAIYGEIVGTFATAANGERMIQYSDSRYPGGPFTNYSATDESKARYVVEKLQAGELPRFTYLLLPNDHTVGTRPGEPTPESMVSDNDYAVGLFIDALSKSEFWAKTAVIIVQDDPQGCEDHVDALRSAVLVVSPWAKRGHVSKVQGAFMSVFATIEAILGLPPLGRPDAAAAPLYDMFTAQPDFAPFDALPRQVPDELNPERAPGGKKSAAQDWRSPDRWPQLGDVLDAYRLYRMGRITHAEAQRRIDALDHDSSDDDSDDRDDDSDEATAFDRDWARYQRWRAEKGLPPAAIPGPRPRP